MFSFFKKKAAPAPEPAVAAPAPAVPAMAEAPQAPAESSTWFNRLRSGLRRTGGSIAQVFTGTRIDDELYDELEAALLQADAGVAATEFLLDDLKRRVKAEKASEPVQVKRLLAESVAELLAPLERELVVGPAEPTVIMVAGVNGAGKTTTIGKLAQKLTGEGKRVMLAAGDTFRAAAVEQLKAWGERTSCQVIAGKPEADPSSVLFDAIAAAKEAGVDVLLADTAGRLHTKTNLMQEMTKIAKTANKALPGAPHEVFLVIDATNGQNAMAQAKEFKEALPLTGLVLTKLDGTAKGGVVLGICDTLQVPVRYVGMGEKAADLHEFDPSSFVEALLGTDGDEIAA